MHFQPIIDLAERKITAFEALIRWQHPARGFVNPNDFIAEAESTGVIVELGRHIIESGCRQLAQWQNDLGDLPECFRLNLNVSPRQLLDPDFYDSLWESVERYSLASRNICLEILSLIHI